MKKALRVAMYQNHGRLLLNREINPYRRLRSRGELGNESVRRKNRFILQFCILVYKIVEGNIVLFRKQWCCDKIITIS